MKLITVATFYNPLDAHLLRAKLESEEIKSVLLDEKMASLRAEHATPVKLQVSEVDVARAKEIIAKTEGVPVTNVEDKMVKCPKCNSTELDKNFKIRTEFHIVLFAMVSLLASFLPIYFKTTHKCKKCGTEFKHPNK